jgi:GH24 family phage-related lysozyme (muramidase)
MSKLVAQLKRHEGVKKFCYLCPAGFETIGVGRNISENNGLGLSFSSSGRYRKPVL